MHFLLLYSMLTHKVIQNAAGKCFVLVDSREYAQQKTQEDHEETIIVNNNNNNNNYVIIKLHCPTSQSVVLTASQLS